MVKKFLKLIVVGCLMIFKLFDNALILLTFIFFLCLTIGLVVVGSYSGITLDDFFQLVLISMIPTLFIAVCSAFRWIVK